MTDVVLCDEISTIIIIIISANVNNTGVIRVCNRNVLITHSNITWHMECWILLVEWSTWRSTADLLMLCSDSVLCCDVWEFVVCEDCRMLVTDLKLAAQHGSGHRSAQPSSDQQTDFHSPPHTSPLISSNMCEPAMIAQEKHPINKPYQ